MNTVIDPRASIRRSQLYRWHMGRNATFVEFGERTFVDRYGDLEQEIYAAQRLGFCDLSLLPRHGVIGRGASKFLRAKGMRLPELPNTSEVQENHDLVVRLSPEEFVCLRLSSLSQGASYESDAWQDTAEQVAFVVPNSDSHCLFSVSGEKASTMFSKVCGVDLRGRSFANGNVAQTSIARVNSIIIRHDFELTENFFVLAATSATEYLWGCILDAADEFDGSPIGIAALRANARY